MAAQALADAAFAWPIRVYWEDTDAGGIVFYANYLKFFERARTEWLRQLGVSQQALRDSSGGMFVVTGTDMHYHRPARLDDTLQVTAEVVEQGRASMLLQQAAWRVAPEQAPVLLCEGTVRIGWVNAHTLRPARLPTELQHLFEPT